MKPQSKSKTFPKGTDFGEIADWFYAQIETDDREVIYAGAEPSMDLITETKSKVLITVTCYPEKSEIKEEK
jgi:hypothetical protein